MTAERFPYGLGWCTQVIGGRAVHWAYGYDDPYSALLIRVPEKKVSFVLLCNCGAASAPFYLGYGNLLTSPFAVHFLREIMPETIHDTDEVYAGVFLRHFTAKLSGSGTDAVPELLARLKNEAPERFRKSDRGLIYVLSERSDPSLDNQMETLAKAYDESRDFHPEVDLAIAGYHKRAGQPDGYIARLHRIADRPGYGEERATRDALHAAWHSAVGPRPADRAQVLMDGRAVRTRHRRGKRLLWTTSWRRCIHNPSKSPRL